MNHRRVLLVIGASLVAACASARPSPGLRSSEPFPISQQVRQFAERVAAGVTERGPAAWRDYFADDKAFFMAAEGRLVFDSNDSAKRGISELERVIAHMELQWREPLRVQVLTESMAFVSAPYHETRVDRAGTTVQEEGYFTGLAALGPGGWRFLNAHWSVVPTTGAR
jgi:hypothetical protein